MPTIPLLAPGVGHMEHDTGTAASKNNIEYAAIQSCLNMYWTPGPSPDIGMWMPTPGLTTADTAAGADTVRGMFYDPITAKLFVASGNDVTRWSGGTETDDIGDLTSTNGRVSFASNPRTDEILVVDGTQGFLLNPSSNTWTNLSGTANFPDNADIVAYLDGYFIAAQSGDATNPGRFYWSNLNDGTTWTATDFATKEGGQDTLIDIIVHNRILYLLGETTTELWYNSGDLDSTFERYQGGYIEVGVAAKHMAAVVDNRVMFPSESYRGTGAVVALSGATAEVISNHYVSSAIEGRTWNTTRDSATNYGFGYSFMESGHEFYAMSNVVLETETSNGKPTLVYDTSTKLWHERAHYGGSSGLNFPSSELWTSVVYAPGTSISSAQGLHVFGHRDGGQLYTPDAGLDITNAGTGNNTNTVPRRIVGPMLRSDTPLRFSEVTLEIGTLTGAGTITSSQIDLYVSKDGGNSWGSAITMNVDAGSYDPAGRVYRAHNLGVGKNWRFRLDFNGGTSFVLKGLYGKTYGNKEPRVAYG